LEGILVRIANKVFNQISESSTFAFTKMFESLKAKKADDMWWIEAQELQESMISSSF
jgi:hypothetical protein